MIIFKPKAYGVTVLGLTNTREKLIEFNTIVKMTIHPIASAHMGGKNKEGYAVVFYPTRKEAKAARSVLESYSYECLTRIKDLDLDKLAMMVIPSMHNKVLDEEALEKGEFFDD